MNEEQFSKTILADLKSNDISALERFEEFLNSKVEKYQKIGRTHEFIDILTFKLKQSKSTLDKAVLAEYIFGLIKKTIKKFNYDPKFVASQVKSLITYYKTRKDYDNAVKVLEFLIKNGITDEMGQKFHIQLDEMYRLNKKLKLKDKRVSKSV